MQVLEKPPLNEGEIHIAALTDANGELLWWWLTHSNQPDQKGQAMQVLEKPPLNEGEIHIAALTDANGELYHLILLPGDNDDATHTSQMEWAKSIGGDLPTRVEQALLWERARDQFKKDWYWSNETHHSESGWAWCQNFSYGDQDSYGKLYEFRARAVRRLPI